MLQEIFGINVKSETRLYLPCPLCKNHHEIGLVAFLIAISRHVPVVCAACGGDFYVNVSCQTRAAELPLQLRPVRC